MYILSAVSNSCRMLKIIVLVQHNHKGGFTLYVTLRQVNVLCDTDSIPKLTMFQNVCNSIISCCM